MATYEVTTHGIWSSHFAEAGKDENAPYDVSQATVSGTTRTARGSPSTASTTSTVSSSTLIELSVFFQRPLWVNWTWIS